MRHLDLFSGIGGFSLAARSVWEDHEPTFCEIDPFCQAVLRKHWPKSEIHGDIRKFRPEGKYHLLTGGFPCQPFSQAGSRMGKEDDRYLWPEMLRVIQEARPDWVVGENVAGIINMALDEVLSSLGSQGYEVRAFVIPAVALNAPHRRDRVWIVGHSKSSEWGVSGHPSRKEEGITESRSRNQHEDASRNSEHTGLNGSQDGEGSGARGDSNQTRENQDEQPSGSTMAWHDAQNPIGQRSSGRVEDKQQILGCRISETENARSGWEKNWIEVATQLCGVDDGLPAKLDGLELSKAKHRAERLKSLGNSIVPQVAEEIFRAIYATNNPQA